MRRMLVISGLLFVVSAIIATGAFAAIQATGASGVWMDVGRPLVNALLNTAGIDEIRAPKSQDGGASWLIVVTFLLAFFVAVVSLVLVIGAGVWLLTRSAPSHDGDASGRRAVVEQAAAAGRRQAAAAVERSSREYAKARPKLAEAVQKGRQTFDDDVKPRVAASAGKAAAKGRRWIEERRNRPPGDS